MNQIKNSLISQENLIIQEFDPVLMTNWCMLSLTAGSIIATVCCPA